MFVCGTNGQFFVCYLQSLRPTEGDYTGSGENKNKT